MCRKIGAFRCRAGIFRCKNGVGDWIPPDFAAHTRGAGRMLGALSVPGRLCRSERGLLLLQLVARLCTNRVGVQDGGMDLMVQSVYLGCIHYGGNQYVESCE